jgi:hypothetical protein
MHVYTKPHKGGNTIFSSELQDNNIGRMKWPGRSGYWELTPNSLCKAIRCRSPKSLMLSSLLTASPACPPAPCPLHDPCGVVAYSRLYKYTTNRQEWKIRNCLFRRLVQAVVVRMKQLLANTDFKRLGSLEVSMVHQHAEGPGIESHTRIFSPPNTSSRWICDLLFFPLILCHRSFLVSWLGLNYRATGVYSGINGSVVESTPNSPGEAIGSQLPIATAFTESIP